jgi:hypothetical protein
MPDAVEMAEKNCGRERGFTFEGCFGGGREGAIHEKKTKEKSDHGKKIVIMGAINEFRRLPKACGSR